MVATPPGFWYRPLPRNYSHQPNMGSQSKGLIQHVAVGGNFSLYGWFSNPAARASSHWWVGYNKGQREQYMNPDSCRGWAQGAGNSDYHSIETAGNPWDRLTDAQVEAEADLYAWGHKRYGWPFRLAEHPGEPGFGWHGMGGTAWGGHPDCPGDLRKAQRADVLRLAEQLVKGPAPAPEPGGLFGMATFKKWNGRKEHLRDGHWRTIRITDKGAMSLAAGGQIVDADAFVAATMAKGVVVQVRFYETDWKAGGKSKRITWHTPSLELTHNGGRSFGTARFKEYVGAGRSGYERRVRCEAIAYGGDADIEVNLRLLQEK